MRGLALLFLLPVALSASPEPPRRLRLELADGSLVRELGKPRVYLVDRNKLRPFTGRAFETLYADYRGVCMVRRIPESRIGDPIGTGTRVVRVKGHAEVWLIDNGKTKRHVSDVPVFERFGFTWPRVATVTLAEMEKLPTGPALR